MSKSENTYAELLLPGESKKREAKEILSFRPRNMKVKLESPTSNSGSHNDSGRSPKFQKTEEHSPAFPPVKLIKTEETDEITAKSTIVKFEENNSVEPVVEEGKVTVLKALQTISMHLGNNKKFTKALRLMMQLIESSMDETNGDIFFIHLSDLMKSCPADRDITIPPYSQGYSDLITLIYSKKKCLKMKMNLYQLETFYILICLRSSLSTDDSYTFNKACSDLKLFITQMSSTDSLNSDGDNSSNNSSNSSSSNSSSSTTGDNDNNQDTTMALTETESIARQKKYQINRESALIVCLDTAFRIYHWAWAKSPCDAVYASAAERRLLFSAESRETFDTLNTADTALILTAPTPYFRFLLSPPIESLDILTMAITAAQRKDASWSGPHTIRTYNSTAHPLLSKNVGLLR